jgi:hypothetical protein
MAGGQAGPSILVGWGEVGVGKLQLMMRVAVTSPAAVRAVAERSKS